MVDKPPYTLDYVAQHLGLSPATLRRLSVSLGLPVLYHPQEPGKPRLMLYSEQEMAILKQCQALVQQGASMAQARQALTGRLKQAQQQATATAADSLQTYADDDRMKAQLAASSLAEYRHHGETSGKRPVFQSVMARLGKPASSGVTRPPALSKGWHAGRGWQSPQNSWMSPVPWLVHGKNSP